MDMNDNIVKWRCAFIGFLMLMCVLFYNRIYISAILPHEMTEEKYTNASSFNGIISELSGLYFEEGPPNCQNHIILNKHHTFDNTTNCTRTIFTDYFSHSRHFYNDGHWTMIDKPEDAEFVPDLCRFNNTSWNLAQCLETNNVKKILITGDSNGHRYFLGLLALFKQNDWTCKLISQETTRGEIRQSDYFWISGLPFEKLHPGHRGCTHCTSRLFKCSRRKTNITLEFIGMIHFIDSSLRLDHDFKGPFENRMLSADTFQEYLLKYYLPYHGIPDVWILSSPIHHETWTSSLEKFKADLVYFTSLLEIYWPKNASILLLPDIRECPERVPPDANYVIKEALNMTRNEKIHQMNQVLFQVMEPYVTDIDSYIQGFMDLGAITCPVMCSWHFDGGHMKDFWYPKILGYLFQLYCLR